MLVYDVVFVTEPTAKFSAPYTKRYAPNSRYRMEEHERLDWAEERCEMFNAGDLSHGRYVVETHEVDSPDRAEDRTEG